MTEEEKIYQAYYQADRLWTGRKAIKELHKITSMPKKDIKSWLAMQALWQVHIPPPKEINHPPHYDVTKPNEQYQFDILYMPHNLFKGNTYKYILTGIKIPLKIYLNQISCQKHLPIKSYEGGGVESAPLPHENYDKK